MDYRRLAEAISDMKNNKPLLDKMSFNARKLAITFFNYEQEYNKFVHIVKEVLGES